MGFLTDTGFIPECSLKELHSLDYLYIESNHDVEMYKRSSKPRHVIRRNLGHTGHLSNDQCGLALGTVGLDQCRMVLLGHISEDDNEPWLALNSAGRHLKPATALASAPARVPGPWSDIWKQLLLNNMAGKVVPK